MESHRDLVAWQRAMDLAVVVHGLSKQFPRNETFGLTSQIRRAAYSVPLNIAEGYGRVHLGEKTHHFSIARGSLAEVETALDLAVRLGYTAATSTTAAVSLAQETGRILNGLIRSLSELPERRATEPRRRPPS